MKVFQKLVFTTIAASFLIFSACSKNNDNNNVVSKSNLPMTGDQESPAKFSLAIGIVNVSYNKSSKMLNFTVNWSSLTGAPTGSHIHGTAAKGANAAIKYDFYSMFPKTTSGTYSGSVMVDGVAIKEDSLLNGFYYMNIHTPTNPGGEIRSQLLFK